jgi:hypothetical protein
MAVSNGKDKLVFSSSLISIEIVSLILFIFLNTAYANHFMVINTDDDGAGSLRAAIDSANSVIGFDTIGFDIPGSTRIMVQSQLPALIDTHGVFINGFSQPGSYIVDPPMNMMVAMFLDGTNAGPSHGIVVESSNNRIQGLAVVNFEQDGIHISPQSEGITNNHLYANSIGIEDFNVTGGNGTNQNELWAGVNITCSPADSSFIHDIIVEGNIISANYANGVCIAGSQFCDVAFNLVVDNYIGTCQFGETDFGNFHSGVYLHNGTHDNTISSNRIGFNNFDGVAIVGNANIDLFTNSNTISGNEIGFYTTGILANNKNGISIGLYGDSLFCGYASYNTIVSNSIMFNDHSGIVVWEHPSSDTNADCNRILQNFISSNGLLGIDLGADGVTMNDSFDYDNGANQETNFPVITYAVSQGIPGSSIFRGHVNIDTDPTLAVVDVFQASRDSTGYGEGWIYITSVVPNSTGEWIAFGGWWVDWVTATVTDVNNNTSEFALCKSVELGIAEESSNTTDFGCRLYQIHPNPAADKTVIRYVIDRQTQVKIGIYSAAGRLVQQLVNEIQNPGSFNIQWSLVDTEYCDVPQGTYFCCMLAGDFMCIKKIIVVR